MRYKMIIPITGCLLFSALTVFSLYVISDKNIHKHNSFLRLFPPHVLVNEAILDVKYNSYYIAGASENKIYLGNSVAQLHLLILDKTHLQDTQHVRLQIDSLQYLNLRSVNVKVDSPNFYIADGTAGKVFKGSIDAWIARRYIYNEPFFSEILPISPGSIVFRAINPVTKQNVIGKQSSHGKQVIADHLLQKQVDGLFCTDGIIDFDAENHRLIYTYFYRNQFICADTNLNLLYRGKTIDTISHVKLKVETISSENALTLSSPPLIVNKTSCVSNNYLFVNSNLMAKNEDANNFENSSVIDVYNLEAAEYAFSFYLHKVNNARLRQFKVFGNSVVAIYDRFVVVYDLRSEFMQALKSDRSYLN